MPTYREAQLRYASKDSGTLVRAAAILSRYQGSDAAEAVELLVDLAAQLDLGVLTTKSE